MVFSATKHSDMLKYTIRDVYEEIAILVIFSVIRHFTWGAEEKPTPFIRVTLTIAPCRTLELNTTQIPLFHTLSQIISGFPAQKSPMTFVSFNVLFLSLYQQLLWLVLLEAISFLQNVMKRWPPWMWHNDIKILFPRKTMIWSKS